MNYAERIDAISLDDLRRTGATKWVGGGDTIGAFVAEMDFGVAPEITKALHEAVDTGGFGYMPKHLTEALAQAFANWSAAEYDRPLGPDDVLAIPDVIKALELAIEQTSRPGSKVIVSTPSYMPFLIVPPMLGREVIEVPLAHENGRYAYDLDGLQKAFDAGGDLLVLCNPYNPIGRVLTREEMLAISELVERNGGRVFSDEIWAPLVFEGRHIPYASISETAANHTITATSASKAWNLPGLKCAQLVLSNDKDRERFKELGHFAGHGTSNLGVVANTAAYAQAKPWLEDTLAYLDRNRRALPDLMAEHLPDVGYTMPEGTYISWLDFSRTPAADNPAAFFRDRAGVAMTEGTACGKVGAGHTRFIFATPLPIMQTAIARMGEALRGAAA